MSTPCIILAGGLGTRLQNTVPNLPKCLAPINGRPFLEWQIMSLANRGLSKFILSLGFRADLVIDVLQQEWAKKFDIHTFVEKSPLGTGGAVKSTMQAFNLDDAIVANGDTFLTGSLDQFLLPLDDKKNELARIATVLVNNRSRFGGLCINSSGQISAFLEKNETSAGLINAGLYKLHKSSFNLVDSENFSLESDLFPKLVTSLSLYGQQISGSFIDIGIPEDYFHLNNNFYNFF